MTNASARFDIAPRGVLDRFELPFAGNARPLRLQPRRILRLDPREPVRPPAPLVLLGAFDERLQRAARRVVDPILIFLRRWRIDHACDMPRAREDEPLRTLEMVHDLPHALRRRDMV